MAKVFRLFHDISVQHWEARANAINADLIKTIEDTSGGKMSKDPTSIPSPFARMDLVRSSFRNLVDLKNLHGDTVYHKIVSDTFDLLEMLFHSDAVGNIEVTSWDTAVDVQNLEQSNSAKHRLLGETLRLFINQDRIFDGNSKIFIISRNYKIFGSSSPLTMFFPTANNLKDSSIVIGNRTLFVAPYASLDEREPEFQKFVYSFIYNNSSFANRFNEVKEYLDLSLRKLEQKNHKLYLDVQEIKNNERYYSENFLPMSFGNDGNEITLFGVPVRKSKGIEINSDFFIKSNKNPFTRTPLILQNEYNTNLRYFQSQNWNDRPIKVPHFDENPVEKRNLPGTIINHPYITVDDFLESSIIKVPYKLESKYFDAGNDQNFSYLLPVKPLFFDFFTADNLMNLKVGGEPMYSIEVLPNSVNVRLRIPIKADGKYITLTKRYKSQGEHTDNNKYGVIKNVRFNVGISPFVTVENSSNNYRIGLFTNSYNGITIKPYLDGNEVTFDHQYLRRSENVAEHKYHILYGKFNLLRVQYDGNSSFLLPLLKPITVGHDNFTYGIDFGTTNTHIEYRKGNESPREFEIQNSDYQVGFMVGQVDSSNQDSTFVNVLKSESSREFLPYSETVFPIRTVVNHSNLLTVQDQKNALAEMSIPFGYSVQNNMVGSVEFTNLKWAASNDLMMRERSKLFIEELFFLLRNKTLFSGGALANTKIAWSYPLSMPPTQINDLEVNFQKNYERFFGGDLSNMSIMNESVAPFEFLKNEGGIVAFEKPVTLIDIGGGTVDIVVFRNNVAEKISSAKFGANSIFSNSNSNIQGNGFLKEIEKFKTNNKDVNPLFDLLKKFENNNQMSEAINLLFFVDESEYYASVQNKFGDQLRANEKLKAVFVFYYSAIIYHVAKLMKTEKYDIPSKLIFSGNGSKILKLIESNSRAALLSEIGKYIFENVYNSEIQNRLSVELKENPKQMTAKGLTWSTDLDTNIRSLKTVLLGDTDDTVIQRDTAIRYSEINDEKVSSISNEVYRFIDIFSKMYGDLNEDHFGLDRDFIHSFQNVLKEDVENYIMLEVKKNNGNDSISDSLFFYPLLNSIYKFAYHVNQ
ncbi:hypothetical protein [Kaistella sp.]|uniref:hypothetical protein n=1 Tax=Kaistella sp. TaxID=2782235 RepID=UPI002F93B80A